jgi:hypothetical protein
LRCGGVEVPDLRMHKTFCKHRKLEWFQRLSVLMVRRNLSECCQSKASCLANLARNVAELCDRDTAVSPRTTGALCANVCTGT